MVSGGLGFLGKEMNMGKRKVELKELRGDGTAR